MLKFLLGSLGRYKEPVVLILAGLLVGPYFLKQAISAFTPLMIESRSIQEDLKKEILASEARSRTYVDLKNDTVLEAINNLKSGVDRINKKIDRFYRFEAVSGMMVPKSKNKN